MEWNSPSAAKYNMHRILLCLHGTLIPLTQGLTQMMELYLNLYNEFSSKASEISSADYNVTLNSNDTHISEC